MISMNKKMKAVFDFLPCCFSESFNISISFLR